MTEPPLTRARPPLRALNPAYVFAVGLALVVAIKLLLLGE